MAALVAEEELSITDPILALSLTDLASRTRWSRLSDRVFYAASTMKVAVLVEVFRQHEAGLLDLDAMTAVATTFPSSVGGSPFSLSPDDVDPELVALGGSAVSIRHLVERMITGSSNEATNCLLQLVGLDGINPLLRRLGATRMRVERLLGDRRAQAAGRDNLVTTSDLSRLMARIANMTAAGRESCREMLAILERQEHRLEIPAALPAGARVANKTGWIEGILHDTAVVWPTDAAPYVLSVCTQGYPTQEEARQAIRAVSERAWERRERFPGSGGPLP